MSQNVGIPLTDLCAICHVNPIKYTCPRDGIHTCSLPCVKRHKQWAQCSGVRDPAEYRKRSELATAASVDKDFNFITKVERSISRADDTVTDRGIDLVPARIRPHDARPKFEVEAEAQNIKVIKAPKGLSRSKQNKTHWGGQPKCIIWTVEWLHQDGRKVMSGAAENKSVKELFDAATVSKRQSRKRKRPSDVEGPQVEIETGGLAGQRSENDATSADSTVFPSALDVSNHMQPEEPVKTDAKVEVVASSTTPEVHFYLHRPNTQSRFKCLIHIPSASSLQEVLNGKTLLEFPTIYVRFDSPEQLEAPFISEGEYVRRHGSDIPIDVIAPLEDAMGEDKDELEEGQLSPLPSIRPDISETKVLEVLAKDLGS